MLSTRWLSSVPTRRAWRNSSNGSWASPKRTSGFRSHPTLRPMRGHLAKARELTRRSVESAIRADSKENGAIWLENAALREAAFGNSAEAQQSSGRGLEARSHESGRRGRSRAGICHGGRYSASRISGARTEQALSLDTQMQSLWLPAIQAQLALNRKNPTARHERAATCLPPSSSGKFRSSPIFPVFIRPIYAARHTWQRGRAKKLPPSFRRSSTTAASSGTAGRERWRIWAWLVRMLCSREPRRERMPMPPASVRSPPTRISSPSGKTPTPTFPS